ncbi:MAG: type III PLP-dependent enzyme [Gammaproteobacteria bacterium]|nr:type III PLP-dependent enzyme [Gammaproteobacteria bacterium]
MSYRFSEPSSLPAGAPDDAGGVVVALDERRRTYADAADYIRQHAPAEPVYLFCADELRARVDAFVNGFDGLVAYAIKANPHRLVLDAVAHAGVDAFDAASLNEIVLARAGRGAVAVHYNNPVKSEAHIAAAYAEHGVRSFALDDRMELDKLCAQVRERHDVELSVRFRLDGCSAWYDFGAKFGAPPADAAMLLRGAREAGFVTSLTFHPGSQCLDPASYARHIEAAADIARGARVELYRLNVGGGFPVAYRGCQVPALERFFEVIDDAVARAFGANRPELVCEPGRAMAASSVSLLCRVTHRRADGSLFLNDGIYGGLMEQLLVPLHPPVRAWRDDLPLVGPTRDCVVFGPTCDSADRLPHLVPLPADIRTGDWVEFGMAGAYGSATATGFNGFRSDRYARVRCGFPSSALSGGA